ncbi:alpha/beta hydrolase [Limnobacter humi]|uniref:Alpha/beta hydrolase n=1 Tax=Limnobacter humi TaxID=1778671 RepID=A0ABT1WF52_9BURK|nr:alpha/beta hydrolase [Limnobacter humi]MCQ8896148.1 alpha/beta hydrolase [Limnobacter humi]
MNARLNLVMTAVERLSEKLVRGALRVSFKGSTQFPLPLPLLRKTMDAGAFLFWTRSDCSVEHRQLGNVSVALLTPKNGPAHKTLLLMHGGAFFAGSLRTHMAMASELAVRCEAQVVLVDYRLAPEHTYPAATNDGLAVYAALMDQYIDPATTFLVGDSAGGGMVLHMAQQLRDQGVELPAGLILISPFVDLTLSSHSIQTRRRDDPMLSEAPLRRGGDAYRGELDAADPRVSPVFGDLTGLPRMLIQCGSDEILLDDTLLLESRAKAAGVMVHCTIYPRMWHNFQMFNALIGAADKALYEVAEFVRD